MGSSISKTNDTPVLTMEQDMSASADFEVETFSFQSSNHSETESDLSTDKDCDVEEDEEMLMERLRVLNDAQALKHLAEAFAHPECPVQSSHPTACARSYFSRPSAPQQEQEEEYDTILQDLCSLRQLAVQYLHPELPVITTDETVCARNYFSRPSAPRQESVEDATEASLIVKDAQILAKLAVDYGHPELPVVTTDETACARNYFSHDASDTKEQADERNKIVNDCKALRQDATSYAHPELGVVTSDPCACGRNYFDRPFAPEQESVEDATEFAHCMEDLVALAKYALDYYHPEFGVVSTDGTACGRNYYDRMSFKGHDDFISSTCEDSFLIVDDDCFLEESDLHYGNFDMDEEMVNDIKYQLHNLFDHCHDHVESEETVDDMHEDEGKLSRSPSSVMLFGGYQPVV